MTRLASVVTKREHLTSNATGGCKLAIGQLGFNKQFFDREIDQTPRPQEVGP
jgi:hypothetical protein